MHPILEIINASISSFNSNIGGYLLMAVLVPTGIFFTVKSGFLQVRGFAHAISCVLGRFDHPSAKGDVSHFQALTTALSSTVGIGNIAGVALAIYYGGPGAVFWMWVTGLLGMMNKFVECTLGLKYRETLSDGTVAGGPMYYIKHGLKNQLGFGAVVLSFLAALSCVLASFGTGNMAQANTLAASVEATYGIPVWGSGLFFASVLFVVVVGGIRRIAQVTSRIVPIMGCFYVFGAAVILCLHIDQVASAFSLIVCSAFTGTAPVGGFIGSTFMLCARYGIARGLFSNEAGQGSAAIAHAAAKTRFPVREGYVALLEPFIDTLVICTITALVIIVTGAWQSGQHGVLMTVYAFETGLAALDLGWLGQHIVTISVVLFAFSTAIGWSYYGDRATVFLLGSSWIFLYRIIYIVMFFFGCIWSLELIWNFADLALMIMTLPNLLAMLLLSGEVFRDIKKYQTEQMTL